MGLKPEQYESLTHLRCQLPYNTKKCDFIPDITKRYRLFHFPNLKVLHFTFIEPQCVAPYFQAPNVKMLIFEGNEGFCNSIFEIMEIVNNQPLLETLVLDIDLAHLSGIGELQPNHTVRHLTIGGFSLFEDCDSNPEYMGWQNNLDIFKLLTLFPSVTSLTLREISMMGCGVPSTPIETIETLKVVYGINHLNGKPLAPSSGILRSSIRSFLSHLPGIRTLKFGQYDRFTDAPGAEPYMQYDQEIQSLNDGFCLEAVTDSYESKQITHLSRKELMDHPKYDQLVQVFEVLGETNGDRGPPKVLPNLKNVHIIDADLGVRVINTMFESFGARSRYDTSEGRGISEGLKLLADGCFTTMSEGRGKLALPVRNGSALASAMALRNHIISGTASLESPAMSEWVIDR